MKMKMKMKTSLSSSTHNCKHKHKADSRATYTCNLYDGGIAVAVVYENCVKPTCISRDPKMHLLPHATYLWIRFICTDRLDVIIPLLERENHMNH